MGFERFVGIVRDIVFSVLFFQENGGRRFGVWRVRGWFLEFVGERVAEDKELKGSLGGRI